MKPCPDEAVLSRYHDGELAAAEMGALKAHVAECELCRTHLQELQRLDERILLSLSKARASSLAAQRRPFRKLLAAAALFLVAGGLALAGLGGRVAKPPGPGANASDRKQYAFVSPGGATYQIKTRGEVQMLSLEIDGAVAHFSPEEGR